MEPFLLGRMTKMQAFFLLFNILFFTFHVDDHGRNAASDAENGKDNDVGHSPSVVFETKYQVNNGGSHHKTAAYGIGQLIFFIFFRFTVRLNRCNK